MSRSKLSPIIENQAPGFVEALILIQERSNQLAEYYKRLLEIQVERLLDYEEGYVRCQSCSLAVYEETDIFRCSCGPIVCVWCVEKLPNIIKTGTVYIGQETPIRVYRCSSCNRTGDVFLTESLPEMPK